MNSGETLKMNVKGILNQMSNYTLSELDFFNPKLAHMRLNISLNTGSLQISMAKTNDPNFSGKPSKGQQIYNHNKKVFFGLNPFECAFIVRNLKAVMDGTYKNPNEKSPIKDGITIVHFRDNIPSTLAVERAVINGKVLGTFKITIFPPKGEDCPITNYILRKDEMDVFVGMIKHAAVDLPYHLCLVRGILKATNKAIYDQEEYEKKNGGGAKKEYTKRPSGDSASFEEDSAPFEEDGSEEATSSDSADDYNVDDIGSEFGFG